MFTQPLDITSVIRSTASVTKFVAAPGS